MTLGAGQGKTIVYLLAAMILNRYDQATFKKFLLLTTSKALKSQLENILINHYTIDIDYKTHAGGDFDMLGKFGLVIVDEADLFIRKFGASFRLEKQLAVLQGIVNLRNGPILFCSATFSKLEDTVLVKLLNCPRANWFHYNSVMEVL